MSKPTNLEQRYGRLLRLYPRAFRREREQEMLSTLMDGAQEGQEWPRPSEATDLLRSAVPMQLKQMKRPNRLVRAHPDLILGIRALLAVWLVVATVLLYRVAGAWALLIIAPMVLNIALAYRIIVFKRSAPNVRG